MPKEQRTFTKEFKQEAVRLAQTSGKSMTQVARDLGRAESTLHHWWKQQAEQGEQAFVGSGHFLEGAQMKYQVIAQHEGAYSVKMMCQTLEVSESGYYAWKRRPLSQQAQANEELARRIRQVPDRQSPDLWQPTSPGRAGRSRGSVFSQTHCAADAARRDQVAKASAAHRHD